MAVGDDGVLGPKDGVPEDLHEGEELVHGGVERETDGRGVFEGSKLDRCHEEVGGEQFVDEGLSDGFEAVGEGIDG